MFPSSKLPWLIGSELGEFRQIAFYQNLKKQVENYILTDVLVYIL